MDHDATYWEDGRGVHWSCHTCRHPGRRNFPDRPTAEWDHAAVADRTAPSVKEPE